MKDALQRLRCAQLRRKFSVITSVKRCARVRAGSHGNENQSRFYICILHAIYTQKLSGVRAYDTHLFDMLIRSLLACIYVTPIGIDLV